ncbi:MAG: DUF6677 family protein [Planctomycetota bacterium]
MKQKPLLSILLAAWLLPGSGHLLSNNKSKGFTILVLVNLLWITGIIISDFEAASRVLHPWLIYPSSGCGATIIASLVDAAEKHVLFGLQSVREYKDVPQWSDTGVLLVCAAGLLNILCLLDVIDIRLNLNREGTSDRNTEVKS